MKKATVLSRKLTDMIDQNCHFCENDERALKQKVDKMTKKTAMLTVP